MSHKENETQKNSRQANELLTKRRTIKKIAIIYSKLFWLVTLIAILAGISLFSQSFEAGFISKSQADLTNYLHEMKATIYEVELQDNLSDDELKNWIETRMAIITEVNSTKANPVEYFRNSAMITIKITEDDKLENVYAITENKAISLYLIEKYREETNRKRVLPNIIVPQDMIDTDNIFDMYEVNKYYMENGNIYITEMTQKPNDGTPIIHKYNYPDTADIVTIEEGQGDILFAGYEELESVHRLNKITDNNIDKSIDTFEKQLNAEFDYSQIEMLTLNNNKYILVFAADTWIPSLYSILFGTVSVAMIFISFGLNLIICSSMWKKMRDVVLTKLDITQLISQ